MSHSPHLFSVAGDWQRRLSLVVEMVRELSQITEPEALIKSYGARMSQLMPERRLISLSRRELSAPLVRITRFSGWTEPVNPWKHRDRLPVLRGGLLSELIYGNEPRLINDFHPDPGDPAASYLAGCRSIAAIPHFDEGVALNMVVFGCEQPDVFDVEQLPELVLISNLFGRATHNLVLASQVQEAYEAVDRELRTVASMQRSLLPASLPEISNLELATHYHTSRRAGGDYYDFFPLPDDRWGMMIADVSGHGTPAAVMMAVTHSIAHMSAAAPLTARGMLDYLNHELASRYTGDLDTFVTAFYGVYDPRRQRLTYASAGHNPPLWRRSESGLQLIEYPRQFPLGVTPEARYEESSVDLQRDDCLVLYTDGITEAHDHHGSLFGLERLQSAVSDAPLDASSVVDKVIERVEEFAQGHSAYDDQTLLVARVV